MRSTRGIQPRHEEHEGYCGVCLLLMIARILSFQAQAPRQPSDQPRFDVASIKINKANDGGSSASRRRALPNRRIHPGSA